MASERDIRGNFEVVRAHLLDFAREEKMPRTGLTMVKAIVNLVEIVVLDIHRIADAAEMTYRNGNDE